MTTRMVTLHLDPSHATLEDVQGKYQLRPGEFDVSFGLVTLDPEQHLYAILVDEQAANRIEGAPDVVGAFSNPKIEPFGPPDVA